MSPPRHDAVEVCPICGRDFRRYEPYYQLIGHLAADHGWDEVLAAIRALQRRAIPPNTGDETL